MASIADFLIWLAETPGAMEDFHEDPNGVMDRYEREHGVTFTAEQRALLTSGELVDIRRKVEAEFNVPGEPRPLVIVWG